MTEHAARTFTVERAGIWLFDDGRSSLVLYDLFEATPKHHTSGTTLSTLDCPSYLRALETEPYALAAMTPGPIRVPANWPDPVWTHWVSQPCWEPDSPAWPRDRRLVHRTRRPG